MAHIQEEVNLLGDATSREEAVRKYRTDCGSRVVDAGSGVLSAASRAKTRVLSHPMVVRAVLFVGRLGFMYDFASDGLVAKSLIDGGNPKWGWFVISFMVLPYVIMLVALLPFVSQSLSEFSHWPQSVTAVFWVPFGIPACVLADVYLNVRYLFSDPAHVQEFHYMTLRAMAELAEAQSQLVLQTYIGLRLWNPWTLFPHVGGASVNPYVLGSSIAISAYTSYETYGKLRFFADNQTGGNMMRFLGHMCQLGHGLAPSNLFTLLKTRRRVVITYDMKTVSYKDMKRLSITAKRAKQLEELIFDDASWISALASGNTSERLVRFIVGDFASAPNLQRLELRGAEEMPAWAVDEVTDVAESHRNLREAHLQGHDHIEGAFVSSLDTAHPMLRAAYQGNRAAVNDAGAARLEVHATALALAAFSGSQELLRKLLLHPGGLEAVHSSLGPERGLVFAGDGFLPLHFAAAGDSGRATELLLLARADVRGTNINGITPLHVAAEDDSAQALEALLASSTASSDGGEEQQQLPFLEMRNVDGSTALFFAAQENSVACVQRLLAARADVNGRSNTGSTPAFIAAQNDCAASLRVLLLANGDPNLVREDGFAPTHMAVQYNNVECLRLLVASRADVNVAVHNGAPPLILAAFYGSTECIEPLLKAGADPQIPWNSMTPLEWAQQEGHDASAAVLRNA